MALEPKYEEARDIRMSVVESRLEEILRRRLAGKGLVIDVKSAPKADPRVAGPRPRGSIVVKKAGLLGKKLAEFHATGAWDISPEFKDEFAPIQKELEARVRAQVARRNADRVRRSLGVLEDDTGPRGFTHLLAIVLDLEAEIAEAEVEGVEAKAEALRKQWKELEPKLKGFPEYENGPWKRDLIPG